MSAERIGKARAGSIAASGLCLAAAVALATAPGWALGVSVGGISADVDIGGGGISADVDVDLGGVDAGVDVDLGGGGGGGGGGTDGGGGGGGDGTGATTGKPRNGVMTASTSGLACAQDGNMTAYNGFPVRDREGEIVGWVHDATVSPENKLLNVRLQSKGETWYKLKGATLRVGNGEIWANVDGASFD